MARRPRLLLPGATYHVMSRGNRKAPIFEDDEDRWEFLSLVTDTSRRFDVHYYAFCLMTNHYHLVCMTPRANLSQAMKHVNGGHAQASNRRHVRTGHLLEGRFHAIIVEKETYLRDLARYVALNPVRAGLVSEPAAWPWSSYRATAGLEVAPSFFDTSWITWAFGGTTYEEAQLKYRLFVNDALTENASLAVDDVLALGTPAFERALRDVVHADRANVRIPRSHRALGRPALRELFVIPSQSVAIRDRCIREAHIRYGYTLAEIGRFLGLHPRTPSAILRRLEARAARAAAGSGVNSQQGNLLTIDT